MSDDRTQSIFDGLIGLAGEGMTAAKHAQQVRASLALLTLLISSLEELSEEGGAQRYGPELQATMPALEQIVEALSSIGDVLEARQELAIAKINDAINGGTDAEV